MDKLTDEAVAGFVRANAELAVVSAYAIGSGGQGAVYTLADGSKWRLTAEQCARVEPRWLHVTAAAKETGRE